MPENIPLSKAKDLVDRTVRAVSGFTDDGIRMSKDPTNFAVSSQILSATNAVQRDLESKVIVRLVIGVIRPAQQAGRKTVPSRLFGPNIASMLMSVVFGYEALGQIDSAKPFLIRNMPGTLNLIAKIGLVAISIGNMVGAVTDGLKAAVDAASSITEMMIAALKWGSVAGGLYLLYGALKPQKAKR